VPNNGVKLYSMKIKIVFVSALFAILMGCSQTPEKQGSEKSQGPITLVIHGGAGTILKEKMTPEKEKIYRQGLQAALDSGFQILKNGGTSVDAVVAAISVLEDNPLFNAGKGSVFTESGKNEMDAAIMSGSDLMAGAVAGVTTIMNPIRAAHAVMTKSEHVMMIGVGAEEFARNQGLIMVDPSYFFDSTRYEQWQKVKQQGASKTALSEDNSDKKFGTVGAVALDQFGNLAAGTSTGGMTNKKYGRVGDAPIIGAGTYADNQACAISATGWGEYFIRLGVAHDIAALVKYAGLTLQDAADSVIMKKLPALGGDGGVIGLDRAGNLTMTFNTPGMYRGFVRDGGKSEILIFKKD
jgi:L-asparaginase / beta-aspartyl-peptidase